MHFTLCDGNFYTRFLGNFVLFLASTSKTVKECRESVNIWQIYCQKHNVTFLWDIVYVMIFIACVFSSLTFWTKGKLWSSKQADSV